MTFLGLDDNQRKQLEYEVVPSRVRLQLTRMLRGAVDSKDLNVYIARMNDVINICRNVLGEPISIIEVNDWGDYEFVDTGWIRAQLELSMRQPDTAELVETIADLIQDHWFKTDEVNEVLASHGCSFSFADAYSDHDVRVEITPVDELEPNSEDEVVNIRLLVRRMETALDGDDFAGVLHASACIFETLAKDVVAIAGVQNQTLASFFDRYKKDSQLPSPILDYILDIYKRRNTEPLAGHGQLDSPTITKEEAVVLVEMTKAFVRIERYLSKVQITKLVKHETK